MRFPEGLQKPKVDRPAVELVSRFFRDLGSVSGDVYAFVDLKAGPARNRLGGVETVCTDAPLATEPYRA